MRQQRSVLLCLVVAAVLGCSSAGAWHYEPASGDLPRARLADVRVGVLPFVDSREEGNKNRTLLYLIPLMPFGTMNYNQVEGAAGFLTHSSYQVRPGEDLAKAVVAELRAANLFTEAFYTEREKDPGIDLLLQGYVQELKYEGKLISYGLSVYGPALWLVGLPAGHTKNTLKVGLELRKAGSNEVLWRSNPQPMKSTVTLGLYYNWGKEFDGYPKMMKEQVDAWLDELSEFVAKNGSRLQ